MQYISGSTGGTIVCSSILPAGTKQKHTKQIDIESFHNELAMRLGYERIVKNKKLLISVEESEEPIVTLIMDGSKNIRFYASETPFEMESLYKSEICDEIKQIREAIHQAYLKSKRELFACYNGF